MTPAKYLVFSVLVSVAGAILVGLYLSGPPSEQRLLRLDEKRVADLSQLATSISFYRRQHDRMPEDQESLVDGQALNSLPLDPETNTAYVLHVIEGEEYQLCASFSRPSPKHRERHFWEHPSGPHCFSFSNTVDSSGHMVQPIIPFSRR